MKYKFSITAKKFLIAAIEVIVAGLISYFTTNSVVYGLAMIPFLEALRNFVKNRWKA